MTSVDFRHAPAATVAAALHSMADIPIIELRAALTNAMERVASLEKYKDELEQLLQAFNEQMKADRPAERTIANSRLRSATDDMRPEVNLCGCPL